MRRVMGMTVVAMLLLMAPLSWTASGFEMTADIQERITWQV